MSFSSTKTLSVLSKVLVAATLLLILVGGMVTTHQAGMAFWTWPLSDNSINPENWTQDKSKLLEHGHRLIGGIVALLTAAICAGIWRNWLAMGMAVLAGAVVAAISHFLGMHQALTGVISVVGTVMMFSMMLKLHIGDSVKTFSTVSYLPVYNLSLVAVWLVCIQAILGGMRVIVEAYISPEAAVSLRVIHGVTAQLFLISVILIAARLSPTGDALLEKEPVEWAKKIRVMAASLIGLYLLQFVMAAILRHQPGGSAGLIISTWPKAQPDGSWLPFQWTGLVIASFLHTRVLPFLMLGHAVGLAIRTAKSAVNESRLRNLGWLVLGLILFQAVLGLQVIWMPKPTARTHVINTHLINGAFVLASATLLYARARFLSVRKTSSTPAP